MFPAHLESNRRRHRKVSLSSISARVPDADRSRSLQRKRSSSSAILAGVMRPGSSPSTEEASPDERQPEHLSGVGQARTADSLSLNSWPGCLMPGANREARRCTNQTPLKNRGAVKLNVDVYHN